MRRRVYGMFKTYIKNIIVLNNAFKFKVATFEFYVSSIMSNTYIQAVPTKLYNVFLFMIKNNMLAMCEEWSDDSDEKND